MRHTLRLDSMPGSGGRKDPGENSLHTKGIYSSDHETYIDSVLREIYDAYKSARSMPSNSGEGLAKYVSKDTVITKRQPDLAARMMLERASLSSQGDYERLTTLQLFLDCVDRTVMSITELVSVCVRFMHSEDNQTQSLRDVDPAAYDGVLSIIDDG